ncbi:MAG: hypothetical protein KKA79_09870 [Nanoarchaeota archaeon]|nr:hypothetical protein [Nanoarchaeota archaeon]
MVLDDVINTIIEGNIEQLLLYLPIFIIGIGFLILVGPYIKNHSGTVKNTFSSLLSKFKRKPQGSEIKKIKEKLEDKEQKIDYTKEVERVLKEKNPAADMDNLLILINQYFSQLLNLRYVFTYEELIKELEKRRKSRLKEFCENLLELEFSKNEVSRAELESIAYEFLNIIKKHPLKWLKKPAPKEFIKRIKFLNRLRRFKKELQRDLEKKKTIQDKIDKVIEKIIKTVWKSIKHHFASTKIPKKVSFNAVLEDVNKHERKKGLKKIFDEEHPTVEGFFYFIYLVVRKKLREERKVKELNNIIKEGRTALLEKGDVIQVRELYNLLIPLYNSISDKNKRKILKKIALFYEDINDIMKFQKAMMYLLQLKLALGSKNSERARQFYSKVSELYEQMPSKYKNEIYEQFLGLEKELNIDIADERGGN